MQWPPADGTDLKYEGKNMSLKRKDGGALAGAISAGWLEMITRPTNAYYYLFRWEGSAPGTSPSDTPAIYWPAWYLVQYTSQWYIRQDPEETGGLARPPLEIPLYTH